MVLCWHVILEQMCVGSTKLVEAVLLLYVIFQSHVQVDNNGVI